MKRLLFILLPLLFFNTEAFARVRICHGHGSCDHLYLPAGLIALAIGVWLLYGKLTQKEFDMSKASEEFKKWNTRDEIVGWIVLICFFILGFVLVFGSLIK